MNVVSALVLFAVIWFVALLVALPIGVRTQGEAGEVVPGTPASAPVDAMIRRKMLWVTVVSLGDLGRRFAPSSSGAGSRSRTSTSSTACERAAAPFPC